MAQPPLPAPEVLARLVSNVTSTMLGIAFAPAEGDVRPMSTTWKTAMLPIPGQRPLTVGLSSDSDSCVALSAAMFSCPKSDVSHDMVDDSLRELTNMTAGLVKSTLALDQVLGLPKVTSEVVPPNLHTPPQGQSVMLKANALGLFLWVCEGIRP